MNQKITHDIGNITILNDLIEKCKSDDHFNDCLTESLEAMLDDLLSDDMFGTEGQTDPRGDRRNL